MIPCDHASMEVKNIKIVILTAINTGGPFTWGRNLTSQLNDNGIVAKHIHTFPQLVKNSVWPDADIVHCTIPITYRLWKKPVVLTVKGDYRREKNIWRFMASKAIQKADVITTPSYFLKEQLKLQSAIVIPNTIDPSKFNTVSHVEKNVINIVTVMPFYFEEKSKGILQIFENLATIQSATNKQINYTVVGGGRYFAFVVEEARKYKIHINFIGISSNPRQYLESSDIFLYYSFFDNFPNVILEAMASGLPVITNDIGAVSEIIDNEKNGFITNNNQSYKEYLLNMIEFPEKRIFIGHNARITTESKFNQQKVVERYISIYREIV